MGTITSPTALSARRTKSRGRPPINLKRAISGMAITVLSLSGIGAIYQAIAERRDARRFPPPGALVNAGRYRLHLIDTGPTHPGPIVLLDTGLGLPSTYMTLLYEQVTRFARVVAYDRPGIGWSDPPPAGEPHDASTTAAALHAALKEAGIPGPYVLVGHSAGGLNMLVFAHLYQQETSGIVLVDSTHPDQFLRYPPKLSKGQQRVQQLAVLFYWGARLGILRLVNGPKLLEAEELPADQKAALQAYFASPRLGSGIQAEAGAFEDLSFPQVRAIESLGSLPMVVLTAGKTAEQIPVQVELHQEFAGLSTNSLHQIVPGASHANLVTGSEYLPAVTAAIQRIFEAVRGGIPLQP